MRTALWSGFFWGERKCGNINFLSKFIIKYYIMKKLLPLSAVFILSLCLLQSCMKERHETKYITLNENLASGATYALDLGPYLDHDDAATISRQAQHFNTSQVDNAGGKNTYHFSIDTKFQNTESVELSIAEDHNGRGDCGHRAETVITINFTIQ